MRVPPIPKVSSSACGENTSQGPSGRSEVTNGIKALSSLSMVINDGLGKTE
jgi:hypothetical protein